MHKIEAITILYFITSLMLMGQSLHIGDAYLKIHAEGDDPLFTTYTASMERSRLYGDKGYKMDYFSGTSPISYSSDQAGSLYTIWMVDKVAIMSKGQFFRKPVVIASFPDLAISTFEPIRNIHVQEVFFVYSSTMAGIQLHIENRDSIEHLVDLYPVFELGNDSLEVTHYSSEYKAYLAHHFETRKRLISNLYASEPYITQARDIFAVDFNPHSYGAYYGGMQNFYNTIKTDWYAKNRSDSLNMCQRGYSNLVAHHGRFFLEPGESITVRIYKGWQGQNEEVGSVFREIQELEEVSWQAFVDQNVSLFQSIPRIEFANSVEKLLYISACNLVRGCMLPPSGQTKYNFYVFSRNPKWGWGHGHQVLHESLSMMAYAYLDPLSAQNSQRVYMEQQRSDGLIAYRHGPRGPQTYPHKGQPTTSAPFFSWINWEIYQVSRDREFLSDAYDSGKKYVDWLMKNRDTDQDGTFEWGPYGLIENVRDWYNVIFQVSEERHLDIDKEDISDELECLDLTLMIINEMRILAEMAKELGKVDDASEWIGKADHISNLVNQRMWDPENNFYFHVDKIAHRFIFLERDLRRPEIIGFLPMWAKVARKDQTEKLIQRLTDPNQFWRKNGIPTLSASDPYYNPNVDYCCKWNGPVWMLWDYMVFKGLLYYGHHDLAQALGKKMIQACITQLSLNHNFWESYSPDHDVLNCPSNYIWDAIMAKLLIEMYQ